jgi:hypothetical protein
MLPLLVLALYLGQSVQGARVPWGRQESCSDNLPKGARVGSVVGDEDGFRFVPGVHEGK